MSRRTWGEVKSYLEDVNLMSKNRFKFYDTPQGKELAMTVKETGETITICEHLKTGEAYNVVYAIYALLTTERNS